MRELKYVQKEVDEGKAMPDLPDLLVITMADEPVELTDEAWDKSSFEDAEKLSYFLNSLPSDFTHMESDMCDVPEKAEDMMKKAIEERKVQAAKEGDASFDVDIAKEPGTMCFNVMMNGQHMADILMDVHYNEEHYDAAKDWDKVLLNDHSASALEEDPAVDWEFFDDLSSAVKEWREEQQEDQSFASTINNLPAMDAAPEQ